MPKLTVVDGLLLLDDTVLSESRGDIGLHVKPNRNLYFNEDMLAEGSDTNAVGIYEAGESLYYDGLELGMKNRVNPAEYSAQGFWIPPVQADGKSMRYWTYAQWIAAYDALVAVEPKFTKHRYNNELGEAIVNPLAGNYELFHYKFEPDSYTKTIFMQVMLHGNELDCRLTVYRMFEALITKRNRSGYTAWQDIYNNCRLIVIPVANPWGNDNIKSYIPYSYGDNTELNGNRNYDFNQSPANQSGYGGRIPFDTPETRHTRDVVLKYGAETIDLAIDYHDAFNVVGHYWVDFNADGRMRPIIMDEFIPYMLNKHGVAPESAMNSNSADGVTGGVTSNWLNKTMGTWVV